MFYATVCYLCETVILCYPIFIFLNNNLDGAWKTHVLNSPITVRYWLVKVPFLKDAMVCFSRHIQVQVFKLCWNQYRTETGGLLKERNCLLFSENSDNAGSDIHVFLAPLCPHWWHPVTSSSGAVTSEWAWLFSLQKPFQSSCQQRCQ